MSVTIVQVLQKIIPVWFAFPVTEPLLGQVDSVSGQTHLNPTLILGATG